MERPSLSLRSSTQRRRISGIDLPSGAIVVSRRYLLVHRLIFLLCVCGLMLVGCASGHGRLTGLVDPSSTATEVKLMALEGGSLTLSGDLARQLGRVPGAQVKVKGRQLGKTGPLVVEGYQILDIGDGVMPLVGRLRWDVSNLILEPGTGRPGVMLDGEKAYEMRQLVGAWVWVTGVVTKEGPMTVLGYGVLEPKSEPGKVNP